jgi:hypothetical protein
MDRGEPLGLIIEGTATDILQEEPETEENIKKLN